ncbi:hypothetical protein E2C01_029148 [Portunus trituberculatus]|uniref:Uncharacterized protein n=1 Tax=Portunus trituberculatus TaxID=210409 RepID=A0A5B7EQQ5_PORTR|nr:hypothetical protein [Portunus trituberculatus]
MLPLSFISVCMFSFFPLYFLLYLSPSDIALHLLHSHHSITSQRSTNVASSITPSVT